jgi:hypothetical protein
VTSYKWFNSYIQSNCVKISPLGQTKSGLITQVTSYKWFNSYIQSNCVKISPLGQTKSGLITQVTSYKWFLIDVPYEQVWVYIASSISTENCIPKNVNLGSPVLGDHNTGILVLCTILVYKFVPVLWFFFQNCVQYWYISNVIKHSDCLSKGH